MNGRPTAAAAGKIDVGGDLTVNRLGFGAMRITGPGVWGDPPDRDRAKQAVRRAIELDVNFIDTADSYGPARWPRAASHACGARRVQPRVRPGHQPRGGPGLGDVPGRDERAGNYLVC